MEKRGIYNHCKMYSSNCLTSSLLQAKGPSASCAPTKFHIWQIDIPVIGGIPKGGYRPELSSSTIRSIPDSITIIDKKEQSTYILPRKMCVFLNSDPSKGYACICFN